ncbi:MAG: hypothetical protein ACFCVF_06040 [Kineosporiaceae bacterium]
MAWWRRPGTRDTSTAPNALVAAARARGAQVGADVDPEELSIVMTA